MLFFYYSLAYDVLRPVFTIDGYNKKDEGDASLWSDDKWLTGFIYVGF